MATTKKADEAAQPKPMTPAEAVAAATATVRAPYEAIRNAQAKAESESKGD